MRINDEAEIQAIFKEADEYVEKNYIPKKQEEQNKETVTLAKPTKPEPKNEPVVP